MDYSSKKVLELRELLWAKGLVKSRWMLTYIRKDEAIRYFESSEVLDSYYVEELRERQKKHMSKALAARKNRALKFGATKLTPEESVKQVVVDNPNLEFLETRQYDEGFVSSTGSRRGKHAIVFLGTGGQEILMTKGEGRMALAFGVTIPFSAFLAPKPNEAGGDFKGLDDVFG